MVLARFSPQFTPVPALLAAGHDEPRRCRSSCRTSGPVSTSVRSAIPPMKPALLSPSARNAPLLSSPQHPWTIAHTRKERALAGCARASHTGKPGHRRRQSAVTPVRQDGGMSLSLTDTWRYPVKSCRGQRLREAKSVRPVRVHHRGPSGRGQGEGPWQRWPGTAAGTRSPSWPSGRSESRITDARPEDMHSQARLAGCLRGCYALGRRAR